jgi:benzoate-CoA ligase family protein
VTAARTAARRTNAAEHYVDRHVDDGRGPRRALLAHDRSWSYEDLLDHVERAGYMLCAAGVRPLDRVAIVLPDTFEAAAILFGAMRVGAIPMPLHTRLVDADYASICASARPTAVVVTNDHVDCMRRVRRQAGWPRTIVTLDEPEAADASAAANTNTSDLFPARPALASGHRADPAPTRPDDVALIQYTSGSTGQPKGVVHLHRGLLALPQAFGARLALQPQDVCFSAAKLFFGYGLGNSLLFPLAAGAGALLRAEPSEPLGVLEAIDAHRPTVFFGGPALYRAMLALGEAAARLDTTSVRLYVSAGETLPAALFRQWQERFGEPILDGLGATECLHVFVSGEPGEPGTLRPGRVGTVVPPYELRLLDDAGAPVPRGTIGHVHVNGPSNCAGYWEDPRATARTIVDGWVRTGDLMRQAVDGTYAYVGRSDDVFKVRGMKVVPLEIEACLNAHPAVLESAVVPAPDRHGTTIACAFVRLDELWTPTSQLARTLRAHVRAALSPHKVPRHVRFVEELPRSATGKLSRQRLREAAAAASERSSGMEVDDAA